MKIKVSKKALKVKKVIRADMRPAIGKISIGRGPSSTYGGSISFPVS
jgi:hypothetical protein